MKKLIIPFVAAFGLSLGAATGIVVVRAPKAVAVSAGSKPAASPKQSDATSAVKDGAATVAAVTAGAVQGVHDSAGSAALSGATTATQPATQPATTASLPTANASLATNGVVASVRSATAKSVPAKQAAPDSLTGVRLAQVFGAMQPKDAARVLEQMDDDDVRAILGSLSSKRQAAILGSFPTQRAALILRATLRTAAAGGAE
jgi:hypothetical protein